jgi:hypothetical protein
MNRHSYHRIGSPFPGILHLRSPLPESNGGLQWHGDSLSPRPCHRSPSQARTRFSPRPCSYQGVPKAHGQKRLAQRLHSSRPLRRHQAFDTVQFHQLISQWLDTSFNPYSKVVPEVSPTAASAPPYLVMLDTITCNSTVQQNRYQIIEIIGSSEEPRCELEHGDVSS